MLISDVLKITNIPRDLGLYFVDSDVVYSDNSPSPFYKSEKGLLYQSDLTVERVNILDCFAAARKDAESYLSKQFDITQIKQKQLYRYVVLYFALVAATRVKGLHETVKKNDLLRYEELLEKELVAHLDFAAIKDMINLKHTIKQDVFLRELRYIVTVKNDFPKKNTVVKNLDFGNKKYCDISDKAFMEVFDDKASLQYSGNDADGFCEVSFNKYQAMSLEGKILKVINEWAYGAMR